MFLKFLFIVLLLEKVSSSDICDSIDKDTKVLYTLSGRILGKCKTTSVLYSNNTRSDVPILSWLSVPYAKPPVEHRRFKRPESISIWEDLLDGTKPPKPCFQRYLSNSAEDCLYLNIFMSLEGFKNTTISNRPILIYIHGGGYVSGNSQDRDPSTLVAMTDIIVITISYRLDALGFLHLADSDASGNQGILDAAMAVEWVYENARTFGGDNTRITVSGQSSGAWSVGYLLFYEPSWEHYRNAIMQSGGPTGIDNIVQIIESDEASSRAKQFFNLIGCSKNSNQNSLECAQKVDTSLLNDALSKMPSYSFAKPVIDDIVFKHNITELSKRNHFKQCNIMTGHTADEYGLFLLKNYYIIGNDPSKYLERAKSFNYEQFVEGMNSVFKPSLRQKLNDTIAEYFSSEEIENLNNSSINFVRYLSQITSDAQYICQSYQIADLYSSAGNKAYVYEFNYRHSLSLIQANLSDYFNNATHVDDLSASFAYLSSFRTKSENTSEERQFTEQFVNYWSNFIKFDDPNNSGNVQWSPFSKGEKKSNSSGDFILFANSGIQMLNDYSSHKCEYWNYTNNENKNNGAKLRILMLHILAAITLSIFNFYSF